MNHFHISHIPNELVLLTNVVPEHNSTVAEKDILECVFA